MQTAVEKSPNSRLGGILNATSSTLRISRMACATKSCIKAGLSFSVVWLLLLYQPDGGGGKGESGGSGERRAESRGAVGVALAYAYMIVEGDPCPYALR